MCETKVAIRYVWLDFVDQTNHPKRFSVIAAYRIPENAVKHRLYPSYGMAIYRGSHDTGTIGDNLTRHIKPFEADYNIE